MTTEERELDYKLRQQASELNKGKKKEEYVIYKVELKKICDLPARQADTVPGSGSPSAQSHDVSGRRSFSQQTSSVTEKDSSCRQA
ncbi:hypothetical protein Q1695_003080 [Nippostrongylus brasiliensis]|nr:hypothetical protein Q1695_003080 [Nippostrongylus brasiliensis]